MLLSFCVGHGLLSSALTVKATHGPAYRWRATALPCLQCAGFRTLQCAPNTSATKELKAFGTTEEYTSNKSDCHWVYYLFTPTLCIFTLVITTKRMFQTYVKMQRVNARLSEGHAALCHTVNILQRRACSTLGVNYAS